MIEQKLSDSQLAVLHNMVDGWELGVWVDSGARIQQGGLGKGGPARRLNIRTFAALRKRNLIVRGAGRDFPVMRYRLTPAGRKAARATL